MVSALALIEEVERRGVSFSIAGDKLRATPGRLIDPALSAEIAANKTAIMAELHRRAEWRVDGCPSFTTLADADPDKESRWGACIACGASWRLHGSPEYADWRRVQDPDDVELLAVRFVVSAAREIVRESVR